MSSLAMPRPGRPRKSRPRCLRPRSHSSHPSIEGGAGSEPNCRSGGACRYTMRIDANTIFEEELSKRGIAFERQDEDTYLLHRDGWTIRASLANVGRNAERDQDAD